MVTFFMVIGVLSWIACSVLIGSSAGRYFGSRAAAWAYLSISLVLSPLVGGLCLFFNHCIDYVDARAKW